MGLLIDSFWRAALYCLYPRVIGLSLLPLVLLVLLSGGLGYLYWDGAVDAVRLWLDQASLLASLWQWLERMGVPNLKTVVAPLLVILAVTPLMVVATLLVVTLFMTPSLARLVAERRFPALERKRGGSLWAGVLWALVSVLLALGALALTLPLWLVPPLALILPALIWGWLSYRVMSFDVLAEFASESERHTLLARHRLSLLAIGVLSGLMGAAPSLVWASGALFAAAFVILVPAAIWIYTLVFAFTSLWFAHYALAALHSLREEEAGHGASRTVLDVTATVIETSAQTSPQTSPHVSERQGPTQDPKDHRHEA